MYIIAVRHLSARLKIVLKIVANACGFQPTWEAHTPTPDDSKGCGWVGLSWVGLGCAVFCWDGIVGVGLGWGVVRCTVGQYVEIRVMLVLAGAGQI